jgi:hypothetical protein
MLQQKNGFDGITAKEIASTLPLAISQLRNLEIEVT